MVENIIIYLYNITVDKTDGSVYCCECNNNIMLYVCEERRVTITRFTSIPRFISGRRVCKT